MLFLIRNFELGNVSNSSDRGAVGGVSFLYEPLKNWTAGLGFGAWDVADVLAIRCFQC